MPAKGSKLPDMKFPRELSYRTNKSGHQGVYWHAGKWTAYIAHRYLGRFVTLREAIACREEAERKYLDERRNQ